MCAKNNEMKTFKEITRDLNMQYPEMLWTLKQMKDILDGNQYILATEKEHKSLEIMREYINFAYKQLNNDIIFPFKNYYKPSEK